MENTVDAMNLSMNQLPGYHTMVIRALLKRSSSTPEWPSVPVGVDGLRVDPRHYERFLTHFAFSAGHRHTVILPYLHVLLQRLQMWFVTREEFPVNPVGLMHAGVQFDSLDAIPVDGIYGARIELQNIKSSQVGTLFDMAIELQRKGTTIATMVNTIFTPEVKEESRRIATMSRMRGVKTPDDKYTKTYQVDVSEARRYALLSRDLNPIHLSGWAARRLGLKQPIAHGMHGVIKVVHLLSQHGLSNLKQLACQFKSQLELPGCGRIEADIGQASGSVQVMTGEKHHLIGTFAIA